jgi:hypothetical protein
MMYYLFFLKEKWCGLLIFCMEDFVCEHGLVG